MVTATRREEAGPAPVGGGTAADGRGWQCGHCGQLFPNLIAAVAHVEVKHPSRERGRGGLT